ncbi:MAG: putative maltokinase [Acidobacteriota bacterium]|nr:putative maltokinase [Acidobacteriota bacterium]
MNAQPRQTEWQDLKNPLEQNLASFLTAQRWFGGKTRPIAHVTIADVVPIPVEGVCAAVLLIQVNYEDGGAETYVAPLIDRLAGSTDSAAQAPSFKISTPSGKEHVLSDALWDRDFQSRALEAISHSQILRGSAGEIACLPTPALETLRHAARVPLEPSVMRAEQSNTSILYGRSLVLKFFRHVEYGVNPDFEIGEFLSVRAGFRHVPPAAGAIEYRVADSSAATIGILQGFVPNRGDAWQQTLAALARFYDHIEGGKPALAPGPVAPRLLAEAHSPLPQRAADFLGEYRASAALLGRRTAELHLALSSDSSDPDFAPEPFSLAHQREVSEAMIHLARETLATLARRAGDLPAALRERAHTVLAGEAELLARFRRLAERPLTGLRTRIHGDLHLGQVLATDDDFVFIDFEGEPARTLAERRAKHSPVRDIAGMLRSFHYAAYAALFARASDAGASSPVFAALAPFANAWYHWVAVEFLRAYLQTADGAAFLPANPDELDFVLDLWLLDKAIYELKYELNHRLAWIAIPLEGICGLLEGAG